MKRLKILCALCSLLCLACTNKNIDFSYSPSAPRAGEDVVFSNLSTKGEKWTWEFGDGGVSTVKNPSRAYKRPGTYTVTLMADSARYKRVSKEITIYDTIPTFTCSTDSIVYMTEVTFTALVYNPYSKTVSYQWHLPKEAVVTSGDETAKSLTVYFNGHDIDVEVGLDITFDGNMTTAQKTYHIYPTSAPALIYATSNEGLSQGAVYYQPLFDIGVTAAEELVAWQGVNTPIDGEVGQISTTSESVLLMMDGCNAAIFSLFSDKRGMINKISQQATVSRIAPWGSKILWTVGNDKLYSFSAIDMASAADISSAAKEVMTLPAGQSFAGGMAVYNQNLIYQSETGVSRVGIPESASVEVSPSVLYTSAKVRDMQLDPVNMKLYIIDDDRLVVANIDGTNPQEYEGIKVTALTLSQERGTVFVATEQGVMEIPLVANPQNKIVAEPEIVSQTTKITAIYFDSREQL